MKRGQMEMVGLVVIVLLLTIGMLFMARFALDDEPAKKIFTRKGLAYSTTSALMKISIDDPSCAARNSRSIQIGADLFDDCAQNYDTFDTNDPSGGLDGFSQYRCNNQHSCRFLKGFVEDQLRQTLGTWNKNYEFRSVLLQGETPQELFIIRNEEPGKGGCARRERDASEVSIPNLRSGDIRNTLYICD